MEPESLHLFFVYRAISESNTMNFESKLMSLKVIRGSIVIRRQTIWDRIKYDLFIYRILMKGSIGALLHYEWIICVI